MPSLQVLESKWLIDVSGSRNSFPPARRHPGSTQVREFTRGNVVIPLVDGSVYMAYLRQAILDLPASSELWFVCWELDNVATLGATDHDPQNRAWDLLEYAANTQNIRISGLVSEHVGPSLLLNLPSVLHFPPLLGKRIVFDDRYPSLGSHHQKFFCLRHPTDPAKSRVLLASMDFTRARWDHPLHLPKDDDRETPMPFSDAKATHDLGLTIQGPAIADLEATFLERWNDPPPEQANTLDIVPTLPEYKINSPLSNPPAPGSQSVQVLRTFGRIKPSDPLRFSWSDTGEFTIWASYLNALQKAQHYIYIEDQYFLPFGIPPFCEQTTSSTARDSDLFFQLGEALRRNVKILATLPHSSEDPGVGPSQNYQRALGIAYLSRIVTNEHRGDLVIARLETSQPGDPTNIRPVFVHSKVMIVDDEFALVGTANFNQRSMSHDSDIMLGIVEDAAEPFAKQLRVRLWMEHLEKQWADVEDADVGYALFKAATESTANPNGIGRVRAYDATVPPKPWLYTPTVMQKVVDPYAGPER